MRHPEPAIVTQYRAIINTWIPQAIPQVCHTCDHYTPQGICAEFNEAPPESFASEPGACQLWVEEIPF